MCAAGSKSPENTVSLQNNIPSEKKKKKHTFLNLASKLEIIKAINSGKKMKEIAKSFGIGLKTGYRIIENKHKIMERTKLKRIADFNIELNEMNVQELPISEAEFQAIVDDNHEQSQQAHRIDPESQQNTESNCNIKELTDDHHLFLYKRTFNKFIRFLRDYDVTQHLSDNKKEELIKELQFLISTMTSIEHLFNDLLMNETWQPFGKFKCFGDVAWVYQLSNEIEERSEVHEVNEKMVICPICYETLKDNGLMLICNKEWRLDRLDYDFNLICRKCDVCFNTTLHSRPAAECIFCIIAFWKIKAIAESEFKNGTNREQH